MAWAYFINIIGNTHSDVDIQHQPQRMQDIMYATKNFPKFCSKDPLLQSRISWDQNAVGEKLLVEFTPLLAVLL